MKKYCHDIETAPNFFSDAIIDYDTDEKIYFEISTRRNDYKDLVDFYRQKMLLIGFNNIHFDDIVINYLLRECRDKDVYETLYGINDIVDTLITIEHNYPLIKKWKYPNRNILQIDLFLYWSKMLRLSKKLSLKSIACQLNHGWIQELPFKPGEPIPEEQFDEVKRYNFNDVEITKKLAKTFKDRVNLRHQIRKDYGINAYSRDDVNMGVDILLNEYCKLTGKDPKKVKDLRTIRKKIKLSEILFDNIKFNQTETDCLPSGKKYTCKSFYDLHQHLKNRVVKSTNEIKYSILYNNTLFDYGSGGIHGMWDGSIIEADDKYMIIDADVTSFYPALCIEYNLYPEHLGPEYTQVYKEIRDRRIKAKELVKTSDDPKIRNKKNLEQAALKLSVNGSYGNYANQYSWLHDIYMTFKTTINGQLLLSMLIEKLTEAGFWVFTANTDGITTLVERSKVDEYYCICDEWMKVSKMELEYQEYIKVVQKDVNNYIWIKEDNGIKKGKTKGLFVTNPDIGNSNDNLIIPKALYAYFVKGKNYKEFILNHDNIFDFCSSPKVAKSYTVYWKEKVQQNLNRFYVSKKGAYLYKQKQGKNKENLLKGFAVQLYNNHVNKPISEYHINYDWYIMKVKEIIYDLESSSSNQIGQLKLF